MKKILSSLLAICLLAVSLPIFAASAAELNLFGDQDILPSEFNSSEKTHSGYTVTKGTYDGKNVKIIKASSDSASTAFNLYKLSRIEDEDKNLIPVETANYIVINYYYASSDAAPALLGNRMSWTQEKVVPENALSKSEDFAPTATVYSQGMVANKWDTLVIPVINDASYAAAQTQFNSKGRFYLHQMKLLPFERPMGKNDTLYIGKITVQSYDPNGNTVFSERTLRFYASVDDQLAGASPVSTTTVKDLKQVKVPVFKGTVPENAEFLSWRCLHDGKTYTAGQAFTMLAGKDVDFIPVFKYSYDFKGIETAYINGYPDGTFLPQNSVTRAEACKIIASLINPTGAYAGPTSFSDVSQDAWYYGAVTTLENAGALSIWSGNFEPSTPIKRHELVEIIYALSIKSGDSMKLSYLTDLDNKKSYFDAVMFAVSKGIITGYEDKTFRPDGNITRAETVTVINRLIGRIYNENTTAASKFTDIDSHWAKGQILSSASAKADGVWNEKTDDAKYVLAGTSATEYIPALYDQSKNLNGNAIREGVDIIAEQMKKDILSTGNTQEYYADKMTGTIYYVSEKNGNDSNDGKSPSTPLKTISALNSKLGTPAKGTSVLFERGGVYRGHMVASSGMVYGSYGEGEKPVLSGSLKNYADPALWEETDKANVYVLKEKVTNVGIIALDHEYHDYGNYDALYGKNRIKGRNISDYKGLGTDLEFFSCADTLYFYSEDGNPGSRFKSIELSGRTDIFDGSGTDIIFDNLNLMYTGGHAIGLSSSKNVTVTNCVFAWIGGSLLGNYGETSTQYGNAVEIFGTCNGYYVKNNWMYQIYDTAVTHQGNQASMMRIEYTSNLMEYCHWSIECWIKKAGANALINNVKAQYNVMRNGGYGWGSIVTKRQTGASLYSYGIMEGTNKNLTCEYNIMDRCAGSLLTIVKESNEVFTKNIYIQDQDGMLGTLKGTGKKATTSGAVDIAKELGDAEGCVVLIPKK